MSPDSSSISTTSSTPSDNSVYQLSPSAHHVSSRMSQSSGALLGGTDDIQPQQQPQQHLNLHLQQPQQQIAHYAVGAPGATMNQQAQQQVLPIVQVRAHQAVGGQTSPNGPNHRSSPIHLWEFLKELLQQVDAGCADASVIRWLDKQKGVFKIEDSVRVAKLWGKRKNKPKMNYDKLSRSIRQYYKKGIMKKTDRSQRLVYQFCSAYCH